LNGGGGFFFLDGSGSWRGPSSSCEAADRKIRDIQTALRRFISSTQQTGWQNEAYLEG
jgi:hypothetical protein